MPLNTATVSTQSCEAAFRSLSFKCNLKPLPTSEKVNEKEFILDNKKWKYCCHLCHEKGLAVELKIIPIMLSQFGIISAKGIYLR